MNIAKQILLNTYTFATSAYRRQRLASLCQEGRAPVCVLFYHRVADHTPNAWSISNGAFQRQMTWLKKRADMVSLPEAQRRSREGNDRLAVSITFDDGYADNCEQALPFLVDQGIPCTYFVSSQFVQLGTPFPHDVEANQPLPPNTMEQLQWMVDNGISLGGHTRTHADLGLIQDADSLQDEVVNSALELSEALGCSIDYFAFPYGLHKNLNAEAARMAAEAGISGVLSAFGAYNLPTPTAPHSHAFHIRRIHGDCQMARLRNWITLDPCKLSRGSGTSVLDSITVPTANHVTLSSGDSS